MRRPARAMVLRIGIAALLLLFVLPAAAVMPPEVYRQARANAEFLVQVRVEAVEMPSFLARLLAGGQLPCRVEGRVVRVFRGADKGMAAGRAVAFPLVCHTPDGWVGGDRIFDRGRLAEAPFLEVFLNRDGGGGYLSADHGMGVTLLDRPTDAPVFKLDRP